MVGRARWLGLFCAPVKLGIEGLVDSGSQVFGELQKICVFSWSLSEEIRGGLHKIEQ